MTLFTGKGDDGLTKIFGCDRRLSKSSNIAEALGTLDECNSLIGLVKAKVKAQSFIVPPNKQTVFVVLHEVQENLFIIQAECAGADKKLDENKIKNLEDMIEAIEKTLPPITSFFIPGSSELSAWFDVCRTVVRRAERRVVQAREENVDLISKDTLAYLNRLSSLFYALARQATSLSGIKEESPTYK